MGYHVLCCGVHVKPMTIILLFYVSENQGVEVKVAVLTITSIDLFREFVLLIPATISSVDLGILVFRWRILPPEDIVKIPISIWCMVILGLFMPVDQKAKIIVM